MRKNFLTYMFALACLSANAQEAETEQNNGDFAIAVASDVEADSTSPKIAVAYEPVVAASNDEAIAVDVVVDMVSNDTIVAPIKNGDFKSDMLAYQYDTMPVAKVKHTFAEYNTTVNGWGYGVRMGICLGGTSPFPIPQEIREIQEFGLNGAFMQEFYGYKLFNERVGLYLGERIAVEGMKTTARVKNYHMSIVQDGEEMAGYYTGIDETNARTVSIKVPIEAMFRVAPRFDLRVGPYLQFNINKSFEGSVYDGYLRVDTPTGQKVEFSKDTYAVYDFSDDMKKFMVGAELAADFKITKHFGAFAHLDWGLNSVFPDDFETISFKMYPIYFSMGLFVGL